MALGGAAMTLGTALAGSVLPGAGDGRGAVEPQAAPSSAATSATAASFPCEVDAGPRARTSGPHAMPFSLGEVSQGRAVRSRHAQPACYPSRSGGQVPITWRRIANSPRW
jgi:hypothetical protein